MLWQIKRYIFNFKNAILNLVTYLIMKLPEKWLNEIPGCEGYYDSYYMEGGCGYGSGIDCQDCICFHYTFDDGENINNRYNYHALDPRSDKRFKRFKNKELDNE